MITIEILVGYSDDYDTCPSVATGCHWSEESYFIGELPPLYPVPALRTDMYYWRMPSYPTWKLVAQWYLWAQGWRPWYNDSI